jgi:phage terminase Nu1 subunit (DNA packaging protein)
VKKSELAKITAEADRLAAENAARRATLWNAEQVNNFWAAKVRLMSSDITELPLRIAKRLPHLSASDMQAIAEEFIMMIEDWGPHELH